MIPLGHDAQTVSQRLDRCPMEGTGSLAPTSQTRRTAPYRRPEGSQQWHPVCPARWHSLADAPTRCSPLGHRLVVLPAVAQGRYLGTYPRDPAPQGQGSQRPRGHAQCGHHRQPVGEDHRKRGPRGYDAGKKVTGRKRHIVVDTLGLLLAVVVHAANIQDRDGAKLVLAQLVRRFPRLKLIWADGSYAGQLVEWALTFGGWLLEIVKRSLDSHQFQVLPRRWVVERTLAWLGRCRRLSKDYEELPQTSEAWVQVAMIHLMLRRLRPT